MISRPIHVLFLNTQDSLRADVSVHVSLAQALSNDHVRVSVATNAYESPGDSALAALESIPHITLMPLDLGRPVSTQSGGARKALAVLQNVRSLATVFRLAMWCRREGLDIVHVTERPRDAAFGLLLARLAGSACLIHAHTSYYADPRWIRARVGDWIVRHADAVVGVSEFTANTYRRSAGLKPNRVFAVHNAVDRAILEPVTPATGRLSMRQRLGLPADARVVGSIARLMQGKDQASLLEAFATVRRTFPDARLVIAGLPADVSPDGNGDYRDFLLRRVNELGLEEAVVFTGFLPHAEIGELFAALDLFVHPSVEEPFGLVLVEAMASSRPVIAVDGGGVPEVMQDRTDGVLVPPRSPTALAEAMLGLFHDPAKADEYVAAGHRRVRAFFTPASQAANMLEVYGRIIAARRRQTACELATALSR